jgi:hypothetical protein
MLHCLLYTSYTPEPLDREALLAILTSAREANARNDVSGILLYGHSRVMQFLEGPYDAVEATFRRISRDRRHSMVQVQVRRPLSERRFGQWTMAFDHMGDTIEVPGVVDLRVIDPIPDPAVGRLDSAIMQLKNFREGVALMAA